MTREEIIDGLEIYTVGRLNKDKIHITVEELQKFIDEIKTLKQEPCEMTAEEYRQRMIQAFYNADCVELIFACVFPTEKEFEHLEWYLKNRYKKEPCEDWHDVPSYEMTLEQARQAVKDLRKKLAEYLWQEPCVDCIRRKAVLDAMYNLCGEGALENNPWRDNPHIDAIVDAILDLSSVTPQPKTGHWILSGGYWRCSECKEKALLKLDRSKGDCKEYIPVKSNYCPNCGRKMMQEVEDGNK